MLHTDIKSLSPSIAPFSQPDFSMTTAGYIVPTITGAISALGSMLILNAIRLSPQKLSTTYHRIMALMSVFDVMASVCMALTTLPMPSDDILRFAGPMIGNKTTCQIQGYFIALGLTGGAALYMCLSWYFVCKMTFQVHTENMKRWIEPVFFVFSTTVAITLPSFYLSNNMINTLPRTPFCLLAPEHSNCTFTIDEEYFVCDEELLRESSKAFSNYTYLVLFFFIMIVIAMVIVIWTISKKNQNIRTALVNRESNNDTNTELHHDVDMSELLYSRVVVVQALMYIMAYFITWFFAIIPVIFDFDKADITFVFRSVLFPLQGLWNLIIFCYDKAYLVHQSDQKMVLWNRFKVVLFSPASIPTVIFHPSVMNIINENNIEEKGSLNSIESFQTKVITGNGVEFLGNDDNLRYFKALNGLHRTGKVEYRREGRVESNCCVSIESPVGLASNDVGSDARSLSMSLYHWNDIEEEVEYDDEEGLVEEEYDDEEGVEED